MPDLQFEIISAEVIQHALAPTLGFQLQITNSIAEEEIFSAALNCQVMIEPVKRPYDEATRTRLYQLFGETEKWRENLKNLFWKSFVVPVPRFTGSTVIELPLACNEDMTTAAGSYFYSLQDGIVPLSFLFSGTVFFRGPGETVHTSQVPWDEEAPFQLQVSLWRRMMDLYFPGVKSLRIDRKLFDRIFEYKTQMAYPSLEACLESLLEQAEEDKLNSR